jgi:hypothetical protein
MLQHASLKRQDFLCHAVMPFLVELHFKQSVGGKICLAQELEKSPVKFGCQE